jgi:flagellar motor switch protein FliG
MPTTSLAIKKDLSNDEKVAVLIASLEARLAAQVLQQLEPSLMLRVTKALRGLGIVPGEIREKTIVTCLQGIHELGEAVHGDESLANTLLVQAVGEKKASALLADSQRSTSNAFSELTRLSADQIVTLLAHEQPAVIALVLRFLPPQLSAEVLELLATEVRRKVIVCMCVNSEPSSEIITRMNELLSAKVAAGSWSKKSSETDRVEFVTQIIQHSKRNVEEDCLSAIQEKSETLANAIRDKLFTFEDIVKMGDVAMRRIMSEIDMGVLAIALRNANAELKDKFFKNMSKRAAEGLKQEMEYSQKVRLSEVEAKQKEIVNIIRSLQAEGQIAASVEDEYV